uniref:5'-nucleotidase domain-containing protein 2-like isoform X2 n=1 Tax=Oncorhynchus gorbuscha TaxID=8017 RepID=UPI001EAEB646|nr:5'-nucleotidase domain-containing protein 2-like isoform X2 [Oncorhynchus gorbuscha]
MSCQKIRKFSHALLQKSKAASLCRGLKTSVASYDNVASRGPTNQIGKCCENGQSCGSNSGIQATGSTAIPTSPSPANHRQVAGKKFKEVSPTFSERAFTTAPKIDSKVYLWSRYNEMKRLVHDLIPPGVCNLLNPSTIYANNEVDLDEVEIYGFDYDYTLALYSNALDTMIYNTAREFLVKHYKYPEGISKYDYIPNFAARGLHYDIQKGLLMKIDAFHYIQLGTVYRGLNPVPDEEVLELYGGTNHVPLEEVSGFYGKGPVMKQFMDVFSIPEMTLLAAANDYFNTNDIEYDPGHLYKDVSDAIGMVHIKGYMYKWIMQDLEKYILRGDETYAVLHRLASHGKKLFLITNSPFSFVDKGMKYMVGKDWRDLFDIVIVQADKPHFFNSCGKPFRRLDSNGDLQWDKIKSLDKGQVYKQGNLFDFLRLTGWRGSKVLYFGDHLYSDLADLMLRHGWRTGAIVPELEVETRVVNTEQYAQGLTWLQALTGLLERMQHVHDVHHHAFWIRVFSDSIMIL